MASIMILLCLIMWYTLIVSGGATKDTVDNDFYDMDHVCCCARNFNSRLFAPWMESRYEESYHYRCAKDTLDCVIVHTCRIPVIHPRYEESCNYRCTKATLDGVIVSTCRIVPHIESRCEGDTYDTVDSQNNVMDKECCGSSSHPSEGIAWYEGDTKDTVDNDLYDLDDTCCEVYNITWAIQDMVEGARNFTLSTVLRPFVGRTGFWLNIRILNPRIIIRDKRSNIRIHNLFPYPGNYNRYPVNTLPVLFSCIIGSSSVPNDTKDRNSCGWFNFPIVSTLRLKTLTDGMRHNRLKIWAHHSRVKRETKDTVNNTDTDSSGYNLYECLCRVLFAICNITMASLLSTAIDMLIISILVWTGLQSISVWANHSRVKRETKDTVNITYTDSSGYNLYECLCRVLFAICSITMAILLLTAIAMLTISILVWTAICSITMAILLLTAIAMLTISILVWTGLQSISELITIWRKVNKFIKKLCQPRCENSSSAAEKQVVQALRTASKRQTFNIASKKQLGLEFLEAFSGSIIIRFITEMGNSLQKIKDVCATGKIREFLPNIFMGTGVESKLGEGDVMWRYFLYKESWRSSGINVDTARAAATEIQEEILNPIKLHWNLFVEELDPRKLYADLKSKGLLGDQDGIEMLKHVSRKDRTVFLLERLNALKEPGLGYKILLDHCSENEYIRHKIMEKEELQGNSKHQEKSTSTGCMSDQKLMFSATILLSVHRKASTIGMKKNTGPECDNEFEITCLDVLDPVCYFDNTVEDMDGDDDLQEIFMKLEQVQEPEEEKIVLKTIEDMGGDDDLQEIFMKLEQVQEPEEEKIVLKTKQPCLKRKRNKQIDA